MPRGWTVPGLGGQPRVSRACAHCGRVRWYRPSEVRTYCSQACFHASQVGRLVKPRVTRTCAVCGASFTRLASALRNAPLLYCSVACGGAARIRENPVAQRFWAKVDRRGPDDCWPWTANMGSDGYGKFWIDGTSKHASRVAWSLTFGVIPDSTPLVCHRCDNPRCCNPAHLFLGTARDNTRDMHEKGRAAMGERHFSHLHPELLPRGERHGSRTKPGALPRGEAHHGAKLTTADVLAMRAARAAGASPKALAAQYGVTPTTVVSICLRRTWQHV